MMCPWEWVKKLVKRSFAFCWILSAGMLFLTGCDSKPDPINTARKYSLRESATYRDVLGSAIFMADTVLGDTVPYRLQPTWPPAVSDTRILFGAVGKGRVRMDRNEANFSCTFTNASPIPVYIIADSRLGAQENMFVPEGEKCVFVNATSLKTIFKEFGLSSEYFRGHYSSSYQKSGVLASMLLHEVGHICHGDSGSYTEPQTIKSVDLSTGGLPSAPSSALNREVLADKFATDQIRQALDANDWQPGLMSFSRSRIANHLFNAIQGAANTFDYYHDPWGAFSHKTHPDLYRVHGYSHLNLNLRLLIMQYQLEQDPKQHTYLEKHLQQLVGLVPMKERQLRDVH